VGAAGQHGGRAQLAEQAGHPGRWPRRIDRNIGGSALEHGQQPDERRGVPLAVERHGVAPAQPEIAEQPCQLVGAAVELAVGEDLLVGGQHGGAVWVPPGGLGKQTGDSGVGPERPRGRVPDAPGRGHRAGGP